MNRKMISIAALVVMSVPAFVSMASAHTAPDGTGPPGYARLNCDPATTCNVVAPLLATSPLGTAASNLQTQAACEMFDHVPKDYSGTGTYSAGDPYLATDTTGVQDALDGNLLLDCSSVGVLGHGANLGNYDGNLDAGIAGVDFHTGGDSLACNWATVDYGGAGRVEGNSPVITVGDKASAQGLSVMFSVGVNGNAPSTRVSPDPTPNTYTGTTALCGSRDNSVTPGSDCSDLLSGEYKDQTHNTFIGSNVYGIATGADNSYQPESFGGLGNAPVGSAEAAIIQAIADAGAAERNALRNMTAGQYNATVTLVNGVLTGTVDPAIAIVDAAVEDGSETTVDGVLASAGLTEDSVPGLDAVDATLDGLLEPTGADGADNDQSANPVCPTPNGNGGNGGVPITGSLDPVNGEEIVWIDTLVSYANGVPQFSAPTIGHACIGNSFTPYAGGAAVSLAMTGTGGFADAVKCANSNL